MAAPRCNWARRVLKFRAMDAPLSFRGRVWALTGRTGALIADIDTDMIYHNAHLHITDVAKMGALTFGNLDGWADFPAKARQGDIVIAGANFGCGSSRQQAVDCFRSLGISAIIAASFGAIYLRNAINCAFPAGILPALGSWNEAAPPLVSGDEIEADFESGIVENLTRGTKIAGMNKWSAVQKEIYLAGGLLNMKAAG